MTCQLASLSSYSVGIGPTQFDAKLAEGTLCPAVMSGYHLSSPRMHFKVGILSEFIYGDQYSSEVKFFSLFRTAIPALRPCGHKVRQRTEWAERSQTGVVRGFFGTRRRPPHPCPCAGRPDRGCRWKPYRDFPALPLVRIGWPLGSVPHLRRTKRQFFLPSDPASNRCSTTGTCQTGRSLLVVPAFATLDTCLL